MIFSSSSSSLMDQEEPTSKKPKHSSSGGGGGSSLEAAKRARGRPLGSKNKPRPPTIVTRELEPSSSMRPNLLEIAPGRDIVASLSAFSTRRNLGVCVLAATGSVSNVALRQPEGRPLALRGTFEILSMSATFLTPGMRAGSPAAADVGAVTVSLAGPGGRVVGGSVVGPVVAAGAAMVVAATFGSVEFHRLPDDELDADEDDVSASAGREESARQQHEQQEEDFDTAPTMNSRGMSMDYSSHLPAESIWTRTPRHYSP